MFLEVHQPIRHLQVRHVVDRAVALERGGIFAVRIDHHDMALRAELADLVEDQRGAGRLAGTGRAEQREMLAEHRIDIQRRADVPGRIDRADLDTGAVVRGVDLLEVGGRDREHRAARRRIARHAAAKLVELAGQFLFVALAEEIDGGGDPVVLPVDELQGADIGDQPGAADPHLDLTADRAGTRDDRIGVSHRRVQRQRVEHHHAARTRDLVHHADAGERVQRRPGGKGCRALHLGHSRIPPASVRSGMTPTGKDCVMALDVRSAGKSSPRPSRTAPTARPRSARA